MTFTELVVKCDSVSFRGHFKGTDVSVAQIFQVNVEKFVLRNVFREHVIHILVVCAFVVL